MLGLKLANEMVTSSITTIHTTRVQEPGRKDADNVSSCCLARNTCTRKVQVKAINAKRMVMNEILNSGSLLRTAVAAQGYHGHRYEAHEASQLVRGRTFAGWA